MLEIRLLGPLELVDDGRAVAVRGAGERALLGLLASSPGRTLPKARLVEALWGESLPADPDNALQVRVSRLRKLLGGRIVTEQGGYRLDVSENQVDTAMFARWIAEERFAEALSLWRGDALAEFADLPWAAAEAARLAELRATAVEEHIDQRLRAGDHVALVAELEALTAAEPLRERLRGLQMLALSRCGRTADALAVFQRFRRLLNEELGVEPTPALRQIEAAILREDAFIMSSPQPPAAEVGNLPAPLASFIGRDEQVRRIRELTAAKRMVTLTGPGGAGKTTLALAAARAIADRFQAGAWFVPLAAVTDPARIAQAVADALGLVDPDTRSTRRLVTAWLAPRQALLVLDNCEHLADSCAAFVHDLLQSSGPRLRVLVTSREALGVAGEVQLPLPPLDDADAARLFVERATAVNPSFVVDEDDAAVRRACERLDRMPLAIELAAARAKTMTAAQIADRLDDRFGLLTQGPRTAEARHQTLRATVDWSHDLLDAEEQTVFRRLAVFRRGWTVTAAEAVCAADLPPSAVLDALGRLADRSLIVAHDGRFHMLETLRVYAAERLEQAGDGADTARRHARYFTELTEQAEPHLQGGEQARWLELLRADDANLQLALGWAAEHRATEPDLALRLGGALGWYWYVGRQTEGLAYLRSALSAAGEHAPLPRARALQALSLVVRPVGCIVHPSAEGALAAEESSALFRDSGDRVRSSISDLLLAVEGVAQPDADLHLAAVARARDMLQNDRHAWGAALADFVEMEIRLHHGDVDRALTLGRSASLAFDALDDDWGRSAVLLHLGYGLRVAGRLPEALEALERAVELSRAGALPNNLARSLAEVGEVHVATGDADGAEPWFTECEQIARDLGNDTLLALAELGHGSTARLRGDSVGAETHVRHALALAGEVFAKGTVRAATALAAVHLDRAEVVPARVQLEAAHAAVGALGDAGLRAAVLEQQARLASVDGDAQRAHQLLQESDDLRRTHGRPRGVLEQRDAAVSVTAAPR